MVIPGHTALLARLRHLVRGLAVLCLWAVPASAASLNITVTASEPVTVTGTPRLAIDVGGVTRYATYASGSGSASLTFAYAVQSGDFDANGITLSSPLDLNGGTVADLAGNPAAALTFTVPDTSAIKVQTYAAAFTTSSITSANANAVGFAISRAPVGAAFTYSITSSGGTGSVTGSGTIAASTHSVTNVDVSALAAGTLTLSVTVSTAAGGTGTARTAAATPVLAGAMDSLPGSAALFSLRLLRGSYNGGLVRVRRSSDDAQRDIAATLAGNLDTTTLSDFCGAWSCFVTTLYDQSGNGQHAVQTTAASQPRIVNGGSLEVEGGRPALRYTAAGQLLVFPAMPGQTIEATLNAVARETDATVLRHVLGNRAPGGGGRIFRASVGGTVYQLSNVGGAGTVTLSGSTLQQRVITLVSGSGSTLLGALDGVTRGPNATSFTASAAPFWIGGEGIAQSSAGDWVGTISEVTVFNVALTTGQRQTLERNQGAHYGIAVQ